VSPVRYELHSYIPEECILHCHSREHFKSYIVTSIIAIILSVKYIVTVIG
jgi:hypothetical protein